MSALHELLHQTQLRILIINKVGNVKYTMTGNYLTGCKLSIYAHIYDMN